MRSRLCVDQGRQDLKTSALRHRENGVHHLLNGLAADRQSAVRAVGLAHPGEQQSEEVVDLGYGAHGRAWISDRGPLIDGQRRRQAIDPVHVRLVHQIQELARVRGERLDVAPLPLSIDGVERQGGFPRPGGPRDYDETGTGYVQIDTLEVVLPGTADPDELLLGRVGHCGAECRRIREGFRRGSHAERARCRARQAVGWGRRGPRPRWAGAR